MANINRSDDISNQKEILECKTPVVAATEIMAAVVQRPQVITGAVASCMGISGAPTGLLRVTRFGGASFYVGSTFLIPAVGTSGAIAISLPAAGSSLLQLQKGDVLSVSFAAANTAALSAVIQVVVQNTQDVKTWY